MVPKKNYSPWTFARARLRAFKLFQRNETLETLVVQEDDKEYVFVREGTRAVSQRYLQYPTHAGLESAKG